MNLEISHRTYDANLHEIYDSARVERLENLAQDEIIYILDNYDVDESTLAERYAAFSAVQWKPGESYLAVENGVTTRYNDTANDSTMAFTFDRVREGNERHPAIYFDDSISQFSLSHEMFHIMSESINNFYILENREIYIKNGLRVYAFDFDQEALTDNQFLSCPYDPALNEGVTELLAKRFQKTQGHPDAKTSFDYHKNHQIAPEYKQWVDLVDILSAPEHNQIVEAYFADDPFAPKNFLNDFGSRQSFVDPSILEYLSRPSSDFFGSDSLPEGFIDERIVLACVEYSVSFYKGDSLDGEWQRIIPIAERIIQQNIRLSHPADSSIKHYYDYVLGAISRIYDNYS